MKGTLKSFPLAIQMILKDPINLLLAIIPTAIALMLYLLTIVTIYSNSDRFVAYFRGYIYTADQATLLAKILTAILILFIFLLMSWTFVIVVGIIAAPFNSMLSERIEKKLTGVRTDPDRKHTFSDMFSRLGKTFVNELKKLIFIAFVAAFAFLLNLFPLFYPVGVFLVATLFAIQFVDYSWSRHDMHFGACLKETLANLIPYSGAGFLFLLMVTVPIINAFVPALATSYFTVLWLHRQNKIKAPVVTPEILPR